MEGTMLGESIRHNSKSISAAARTINQSFAADPLIRWLRPNARPWGENDVQSMKWQRRRVLRALADGSVIGFWGSSPVKSTQTQSTRASIDNLHQKSTIPSPDDSYAAVAIFEFPTLSWREKLSRLISSFWVWILDCACPVPDPGSDENRIKTMLESHDIHAEMIKSQVSLTPLYLEVMAVHPSHQGEGLGGALMRSVIARANEHPIFLECTDKQNIAFYEKFGFKVVKEIQLEDADTGSITTWLMLRE